MFALINGAGLAEQTHASQASPFTSAVFKYYYTKRLSCHLESKSEQNCTIKIFLKQHSQITFCFTTDTLQYKYSKMEKIISNPGLQYLTEKVFWDLSAEDLKICAQINQSCKHILQNPIFGLRKFKGLSKKNRNDWIKGIQSVKNSDKGIAIISYLKWNLKKEVLVDIPFYSSDDIQDDFRKRIRDISMKWEPSVENIEMIKILAPLTENPNAPDKYGSTPIYNATYHSGHTAIVKILAALTDNPNTPDDHGRTPIYWAACNGHTEIVEILAPLTKNPNAPNKYGQTPIYVAASNGHAKIVKILAPLTDNPNAQNPN